MIGQGAYRPVPDDVIVRDEYDVSRARVAVTTLAQQAGFTRGAVYRLATAVSELASNLVFHAKAGGVIHLSTVRRDGRSGIEVVAEDQGPGIADIELAMTDGHSTNGGLGSGLPGCRRLVDEFEIQSAAGSGTRVVVRLWH
ncbi:MAG: anti-sigma regulatory factor [Bacteroidales bacterium]